jgi:hypothetical protein
MAKYKVWVRCAVCGDAHPMAGVIDLSDGPTLTTTVSQAYEGKVIPSELQSFIESGTTCPKCGLRFCPRKEYVFLVPTPDGSSLSF